MVLTSVDSDLDLIIYLPDYISMHFTINTFILMMFEILLIKMTFL